MRTVLILIVLAVIGLLAYIRLAPSDPATWHTDPLAAGPGMNHFVVKPEGGDIPGPVLTVSPAEALSALDAIARATPRTTVLAGSVEEGRITYVTRSAGFGFPDYTTIAALEGEQGTRLAIFARSRFGQSDLGVNRARVEGWLAELEATVPAT